MYFASRAQAGRMLAAQLMPIYRYENCAVVALDPGGVAIGAQIAIQLHCPINMLLSEEINLPREPQAIASIAQDGSFTYNKDYSEGELFELQSEYNQYIEAQKVEKLQQMHRLLGSGGTIRKDLLRGRYIILVTDGLKNGHTLDIVVQYLKPVASEGIIIATPLASVPAVDYMHILADDMYCLSVIENYMDTPHYYDKDDVPDKKKVVEIIEKIVLNWK
jgi:putative phosphoribosyl transferase